MMMIEWKKLIFCLGFILLYFSGLLDLGMSQSSIETCPSFDTIMQEKKIKCTGTARDRKSTQKGGKEELE